MVGLRRRHAEPDQNEETAVARTRKPSPAKTAPAKTAPAKAAPSKAAPGEPQPDWRVFAVASLAALLAFMLLPSFDNLRALLPGFDANTTIVAMTLFRGIVAGCVAGLTLKRPFSWWAAPAAAAVAIVVGLPAVALIPSVGVGVVITRAASQAPPTTLYAIGLIVGLVAGCGVAVLVSSLASADMTLFAEVVALVLLVGILLSCSGLLPGIVPHAKLGTRSALLSMSPEPKAYTTDTMGYLRTYDLMKSGEGYYAAFAQGVKDNSYDIVINSPFNYREPFVFFLWKILPGDTGMALLYWFVFYAAVVLILSYVLASSLVGRGVALLAPIALVGWFTYFFWTTYFPQTEVWAAGFGLAAVMCLVRKWRIPSLVLLTAAVAAREFMVLLIPAWLLVAWFSRARIKQNWWFPAAAVLGPAIVLGAHFLAVPPTSGGAGVATRWLHGGPAALLGTLRYGFDAVHAGQWLALAIGAAAIAGAALARPSWKMYALLAVTVLPTIFLFSVSGGADWDYWGAFYIPLAIAIAPSVFARILPAEGRTG